MTTTRHTVSDHLPRLMFIAPFCEHCTEAVVIEDGGAWCPRCLVQWDTVDEDAEPAPALDYLDDSHGDLCAMPGARDGLPPDVDGDTICTYERDAPCILLAGHEGAHRRPRTWTTVTPDPA